MKETTVTVLENNELIDETIRIFDAVRTSTIHAAAALHACVEQEAWKGRFGSFSEFVEGGLQISKGHASKLLSVYKHYVLEGGIEQESLAEVDAEKLYLAIRLEEPPEKKMEIARLLSRRDLKETSNERSPHDHVPISICSVCRIKLD